MPGLDTNSSSYHKAVAYAQPSFQAVSNKRQRSKGGSDYIRVAQGTTLAFPNSTEQVSGNIFTISVSYMNLILFSAAASSSSSAAASSVLGQARSLVKNISTSKSERALVKAEADLRSELDITLSRVNYLLQYFDLIKAQHIQVLKDLHVVEGFVTPTD